MLGIFTFGSLLAFGLLFLVDNLIFLQVVNIISMLVAIALLVMWRRYSASSKAFVNEWKFWVMASAVGSVFPMLVLLRQTLMPGRDWLRVIVSA